jgi:hypothetical protein
MHLCTATRFLRHGQGKGLWPSFLSVLETNGDVHQHFEQARATATEVFQLFLRAMKSVGHVQALYAPEWHAVVARVIVGRETIAADRS